MVEDSDTRSIYMYVIRYRCELVFWAKNWSNGTGTEKYILMMYLTEELLDQDSCPVMEMMSLWPLHQLAARLALHFPLQPAG